MTDGRRCHSGIVYVRLFLEHLCDHEAFHGVWDHSISDAIYGVGGEDVLLLSLASILAFCLPAYEFPAMYF